MSIPSAPPSPPTLTCRMLCPHVLSDLASLRRCCGQALLPGAHDHEPQHCGHLSERYRLRDGKRLVPVRWKQQADKAEGKPCKAGDHQPDAEEAGHEAGLVHQEVKLVMQVEE